MVPAHDRHPVLRRLPPQVGVVAGPVDGVEVVHEVLEGQVGGERLHVEPVGQARREVGVAALVDEPEELDERGEVVAAALLVEHVLVRRRVRAAVAVVTSGLGLVEDPVAGQRLRGPRVTGWLEHHPQRRGVAHRHPGVGVVLARQPRRREEVECHRLVEAAGRAVDAHDHVGDTPVVLPVDHLVEPHQPGVLLGTGTGVGAAQRRVALEPQPAPFVRRAVEGHRHLEPGLLTRLLEGRQGGAEVGVLDTEHHLVQAVGREQARPGRGRGCRGRATTAAGERGAGRPVTPAGNGDRGADGDEGAEPAEEDGPATGGTRWGGWCRHRTSAGCAPRSPPSGRCRPAVKRGQPAAAESWCSTWSTESTCWITIVAAPMTPACPPVREATICSSPVASGSERP